MYSIQLGENGFILAAVETSGPIVGENIIEVDKYETTLVGRYYNRNDGKIYRFFRDGEYTNEESP